MKCATGPDNPCSGKTHQRASLKSGNLRTASSDSRTLDADIARLGSVCAHFHDGGRHPFTQMTHIAQCWIDVMCV